MSLVKNTVWRERLNLQLRMDAFNVFNHPNFATPNAAVSNPSNFGQITATTGEKIGRSNLPPSFPSDEAAGRSMR